AQKVAQNAIDFRELRQQRAQLNVAARAYEEELNAWSHRATPLSADKIVKLNDLLTHAEQSLLLPEGLPGRDWYRHSLYAPGIYTGYLPKTLPGIREAAEAQKWDDANRETKRVTGALRAMTAQVEEATRLLRP